MSERLLAVEPPDESIGEWTVFAKNNRVVKGWEWLLDKAPEHTRECFYRLREKPMERVPGRVFPLKHKDHKGSWEYEVTGGDRVFYTPDLANKKVVVFYAGKHVSPAPKP
jgi:hypothetical protein